jgi:hypothetical protein
VYGKAQGQEEGRKEEGRKEKEEVTTARLVGRRLRAFETGSRHGGR